MPTTIYPFQVTVPKGTQKTNLQYTDLTLPVAQVDIIDIRVPHGPLGTLGIALAMGGQQVIPFTSGTYLILDNDRIEWSLEDLPTSGAWQLVAYNTGQWDHTVYLRFHVSPPPAGPASSGSYAPISTLHGVS